MDFMLWSVKGYTGVQLTKEKLHNKKYSLDEIKNNDSSIVKQIEENLENGGIIFALSKKKIIKAIYFFKLTTNGNEKTLVFDKKVVLDEANKCIKQFENDIDTVLNGVLFNRHDIDKAVWKEKEVTKKEKFKSAITGVKSLVWIGIIIYCIMSLAILVCSTSHFLFAVNSSIDEIKKDEQIINYVSDINNYSYSETIEIMSDFDDVVGFAVIEIILPTVFILFGYILLIISLKEILTLTKNVTDNQSLFTNDKNQLLKKIILRGYIALLFVLSNFILWLGIGVILEIIQYMFNYCVQLTNDKK